MKENLGWLFWTTFIIALIGAASWTPQIYNWFQKSEIKGRILSNYGNIGTVPNTNKQQLVYVQKISLFSKNRDFFLKNVKVFIKYPSTENELECTLWTWRNLIFTFNENDMDIKKNLNISLNHYLIHNVIFPKNETVVGYISFSVDYLKDEMFEYVRYEFIDYNDKKKKLTINKNEIESNKLIHEDNIWIK